MLFVEFLFFVCVSSASTGEQGIVGLDEAEPAAPVSLQELCSAPLVNYGAIRTKVLEGHPGFSSILECIKTFCEKNDLGGLQAIHADSRTMGEYLDFGLDIATKFGSVDAIEFYAKCDDATSGDFKKHAMQAADIGRLDAFRCFLSHEKFPHSEDLGLAAIFKAVRRGHASIVRWFLNEYVTPSQHEFYIIARVAHFHSFWNIVDILVQHGLNVNSDASSVEMPEIRNAYNAWKQRHDESVAELQAHFPKDVAEAVFEELD